MTFPAAGGCGAVCPGANAGAGVSFGVVAEADGVPAREELVDGGRDQPGPVVAERCISVVSLAVTNLECVTEF